MICYRDTTFCANEHCTCPPHRRLTDEVRAAARRWWGGDNAPIAYADLCGGKEPVSEEKS